MTVVQIFNQYSFLLLSAIALAMVAAVLTRRRARPIFWVVWGWGISRRRRLRAD
ncbi:MAG: hypothetical protein KatS3mg052_2294 [Candidatus Roseilinea sp.]|nr:MAG: hypothetical protein KatS3mg052_2294 [Candidatus Roseilinea sp.]